MPAEKQGRRLDSWKEIAEYLGRDLRTVMRWEERGMPVHRLPGGKRQAVFALTEELDTWLVRQAAEPQSVEEIVEPPSEGTLGAVVPSSPSRSRRLIPALVMLALAVVALLVWSNPFKKGPPSAPDAVPREVALEGPGFSLRYAWSEVPLGIRAYASTTADVNHDGNPDLIFTTSPNDVIGVILGKGDGVFESPRILEDCPQADRLRIIDLNRDGHLDIAVTCMLADKVVVLWGKGDGTFPARAEISVPGGPRHIAAGDLDGDGWPELAVTAYGLSDLYIVRNNKGTFTPVRLAHFNNVTSVELMDWDSDGKLDIVAPVHSQGKAEVAVFRGRGNGAFRPAEFHTWPAMRGLGTDIALADLDQDNSPDLVISQWQGDLFVLRGLGQGRFAPPQVLKQMWSSWNPAVADLDLDGKLDILVVDSRRGTLMLHHNSGGHSFSASDEVPLGSYPAFPLVADFNRDGLPDIVVNLWAEGQTGRTVLLLAKRPPGARK